MIAMATRCIRDDSNDKQFVDYWNNASKAVRAKLLTDAGRNPNYKYRAWDFIPHEIRVDVVTIIKRTTQAPKPRQVNTDHFWWTKD